MFRPRAALIKQAFELDRAGKPRWRERPTAHFKNEHARSVFNSQWPGKVAGSITPNGQHRIFMTLGREKHNIAADAIVHVLARGRWPAKRGANR
jgi:hypothetical protein